MRRSIGWMLLAARFMTVLCAFAVSTCVVARAAAPKQPQATPSMFATEQQLSPAQRMKRWAPFIAEAARRFDVPQVWIRAVMQIESGGRTMLTQTEPMRSSMGAMGLMQLMPATYNDMRVQYRLGANPYDPHDNILAGAAYLKFLRGKYPYPALFAAYNDGPGNLETRLRAGGLLPPETVNYVGMITGRLGGAIGRAGAISQTPRTGSAKFTKPNGAPVWVEAAAVASVRAPFPGEYAAGVQSVISAGRAHQGVRESVARVKALLRKHGGGI